MAVHLIRRGAPLLAAAALLSACGTSGGNDASSTTAATERTTTTERTVTAPPDTAPKGEDYGEDDCPSAEAVAKAIGTTLERSMSFGGGLDGDISTTTSGCSYRRAESAATTTTSGSSFSSEEVTVTRISTEAKIAGRLFDLLDEAAAKDAAENGFTPVKGLGDGAYQDGQQLVIHTGGAMVFVKVEPGPDATAPAAKTTRALATDVVDLKPDAATPPDCATLKKLVKARLGAFTQAISNSSYLGFGDDISITSTGCSVTLADETDVTISVANDDHWDDWVKDKEDSPFTASYRATEVAGRKAFATDDGLVVDDGTTGTGDSPYKVAVEGFGLSDAAVARAQEQIAVLAIGG